MVVHFQMECNVAQMETFQLRVNIDSLLLTLWKSKQIFVKLIHVPGWTDTDIHIDSLCQPCVSLY